jgi:Domain of unknown function (DUF4372)
MNAGRTVFAQLIAHLSHIEFQKCVARYDGDDHHQSLSCWDQYLAMAFAQFTYRESLRDIEACLRSMSGKLYHMGFRSRIARSTLADANETHNWRIFADFAQHLIGVARPLHAEDPMGVDLAPQPLCARFDHHRSLSRLVSVGEVATAQRRGEDAHAAGPAR